MLPAYKFFKLWHSWQDREVSISPLRIYKIYSIVNLAVYKYPLWFVRVIIREDLIIRIAVAQIQGVHI